MMSDIEEKYSQMTKQKYQLTVEAIQLGDEDFSESNDWYGPNWWFIYQNGKHIWSMSNEVFISHGFKLIEEADND